MQNKLRYNIKMEIAGKFVIKNLPNKQNGYLKLR